MVDTLSLEEKVDEIVIKLTKMSVLLQETRKIVNHNSERVLKINDELTQIRGQVDSNSRTLKTIKSIGWFIFSTIVGSFIVQLIQIYLLSK